MMVNLVDAAIQYDNTHNGKSYILVTQNVQHALSIQYNLLPHIVLREAGTVVNNIPKIEQNSPNVGDHAIIFPWMRLHKPLSLWGIFPYFPMTKLKHDVYTPSAWNPHTNVYATNEESLVDWEGNMSQERDQKKWLVLDDISDGQGMISSLVAPREEHSTINSLHEEVPLRLQCICPSQGL